jgi:ferric-dicitrate binding protein FerR (iron transport regulator)
MTRHVPPERWAAAEVRADVLAHAESCARCAAARARVQAARAAMAGLREADPLSPAAWDRLDARMHWTVSKTAREHAAGQDAVAPRRRPWLLAGALALASVAFAVQALWPAPHGQVASRPVARHDLVPQPVQVAAAAVPLEGVVTLIEGEALIDGAPLTMTTTLHAGAHLATGRGRVDVQFGDGSAFVLEPRSVLELAAFDSREVALRVEGAVGVMVSHRAPDQRFAVLVQGRRVEVRGTVFRVSGTAVGLGVQVLRGRVAVMDGVTSVEVPAGSGLMVPPGAALLGHEASPLAGAELARAGERLQMTTLRAFSDARLARASSGVLEVGADRGQSVRIDDVPVGKGSLDVRLEPGRYLVRAGGAASHWIEVESKGTQTLQVGAGPAVESERPRQFEAEIRRLRNRLRGCARQASDGDGGGKLVINIQILADGSVNSVVPLKDLADSDLQECLLGVIRGSFTFPAGSAGTIRKSIRLGSL